MRSVAVPPALLESMRRLAAEAYPEECCGFLLSREGDDGDTRSVVAIESAANRSDDARERRFVIRPEELRDAERRAAAHGTLVSGFFHSHPDHPARPSAFDQEHAWPWYVYLILASGAARSAREVGAFELDPERREFRALALVAGGPPLLDASLRGPMSGPR